MEDTNVVTITQHRYEELLDIETRVDVVVDMISSDGYLCVSSLLNILGTKRAIDTKNKMKEKMSDFSIGGLLDESDD